MAAGGLLTSAREAVPLRGISVDVDVRGFVADVVSELRYRNGEANPVEVRFVFPLDAEASVYAFEGLMGGTRIEAQIREKAQAEQAYEDGLSGGRPAFLLEREDRVSDVFSCLLGNLPAAGEALLRLRYVQSLAPEPDGALRFVLPAVLNPRYVPEGSERGTATGSIPRVPKGELPYTLSLSATLESPCGVLRVESKCPLQPLRYTGGSRAAAQVALADGHRFDRDVELLIYYCDVHKPSAILEAGKPGSPPGSLMGDPVVLLALYPEPPAPEPARTVAGEFIFLLDRSGSMECQTEDGSDAPSRLQCAKETLVYLLKSLPLGCFFNVYGFGSSYDSFYPRSVEYSQQTMAEALRRAAKLEADLGGTEVLRPLQAIYAQPCREGHPRRLFVFTDGEVENADEVLLEVRRHGGSHRCFSFGIGEGASTALLKGMARAAGGSAEFIAGTERMQAKALKSLKEALQPAATGVSLHWDLPSGLEAALVGPGPPVLFPGHRCLLFAQIRGQLRSPGSTEGSVVLRYVFRDQTFAEILKFRLPAPESRGLPVHRLAAQALLQELEGAGGTEEERRRLALETSLSSGVVCSQTAYVGVNTELGKPIQAPLVYREVPLAGLSIDLLQLSCSPVQARSTRRTRRAVFLSYEEEEGEEEEEEEGRGGGEFEDGTRDILLKPDSGLRSPPSPTRETPPSVSHAKGEESALFGLISLQNADGSWSFDPALVTALGLDETDASKGTPARVASNVWGTVLAVLWLHARAEEQSDEWGLLEAKAQGWLKATAGPQLAEWVEAGNALMGTSVDPQVFGL